VEEFNNMAHPDDEMLDQYATSRLGEERLAEVEEHLLICSTCQARLSELDDFLASFRLAAPQVAARDARLWQKVWSFRPVYWAAPVTAAAALLFGVGLWETRKPLAEPAVVMMQSFRGPADVPRIVAGKPALLTFDLTVPSQPANYQIEMVDADGNPVLKTVVQAEGRRFVVPVKKLSRGSYWIRVYRNEGERELIEECGLRAE
jgi:hypothetical protein